MKIHYYFILIFLFAVNMVFPQSDVHNHLELTETDTITVNPELPQYVVKIYTKDENHWDTTVKIYVVGDTALVQSFDPNECCLNIDDSLIDINFDGYNDLQITGSWHNTIYTASSFWLFNPESKKFEESEEFSEFDEIEVNKENRTITSYAASAGNDKNGWSQTYKVVNNHLVLITEDKSYRYDREKKELQGDSMVTIYKTYEEGKYDSLGYEINGILLHNLSIINTENLIYGKLRPIKKVWQWYYDGSEPGKFGKRLVQEMWAMDYVYVFEKEIRYEYSKDENENIYVQEIVGDIINGEWTEQTKPKTLLKEE